MICSFFRHNFSEGFSLNMTESQFIDKIKELKTIKPRQEWVVLTKQQLFFNENPYKKTGSILDIFPGLFFQKRAVFAGSLALFFLIVGSFIAAQDSLPGDFLYPARRLTERAQAVLLANNESSADLEFANNRIEDLTRIAEENQVQNLAPAIQEFQANVSEATKKITSKITKSDPKTVKEIALQVKKIEENRIKVEKLGVVLGDTDELNNAIGTLVEREIKDLEARNLTPDQQEILNQAKTDFDAKNYSQSLELIWNISNQ